MKSFPLPSPISAINNKEQYLLNPSIALSIKDGFFFIFSSVKSFNK